MMNQPANGGYQYQQQPTQQQSWPPQQQQQQSYQQYQAAAAAPQQMYYQQQPQAAAQPFYSAAAPPSAADEVRTLWIGNLMYWMDESYIAGCFNQNGEVTNVKVIRNKQTQQPEGYGFVEFISHASAERILQQYNGTPMLNTGQTYRLNWASPGGGEKRSDSSTPEYTVFVGDLSAEVSDSLLEATFSPLYTSIKSAKVVTDKLTGRPKGYGFVSFGDESEQLRAMVEMNGKYCTIRPMRIGPAANKKSTVSNQHTQGNQTEDDPNNTTVFVGGLNESVSDDLLRQTFSPFGQLTHVKIPVGKRCGFVQFTDRHSAEEAIKVLSGTQLGGQTIRLSWGKTPSNKQPQAADANQWNNNAAYYGGGGYPQQGYGNYPYGAPAAAPAAAPQDPNMYYGGGYPGYANYQQAPPQQ